MKVSVLTTSSRNAGGLFYSVRWLSKALFGKGVSPVVLSPLNEFSEADRSVWNPISVELYPVFGPMQASFKLRGLLKNSEPNLIHQHGIWTDSQWAAAQYQKTTGVPVVVSPRGMLDPWAVQNSAWKKKLVGKLFADKALRKASCIHALCQSEADSIRSYGLKNPIAIIPNGVELPNLDASNSKPQTANRRKKLLFLGRIHPKKGLKELIKAWAKAQVLNPKALSDWQLVIAGWDDGGYESGLKQLVSQLGADDSIEFLGPKFGEEKDRLLRSADAFILPSFSEGLPMSVLEAWSYGLPVVMTDQCNLPEGFAAGAAIRIEPAVGPVAEGLMQLAGMERDNLRAMGMKGRKLVECSYTWDKIATDMKAVYEWCLGGETPACILKD